MIYIPTRADLVLPVLTYAPQRLMRQLIRHTEIYTNILAGGP